MASPNPNRFGPNSQGVVRAVELMQQLETDQWAIVIAARKRILADPSLKATLGPALDAAFSGSASKRNAVEKLQSTELVRNKTVQQRVDATGIDLAFSSFITSTGIALGAIANREKFTDELFAIATAGYPEVGIDCETLARMGKFEDD